MTISKKVAALVAAIAVLAGAGVAFAQTSGDAGFDPAVAGGTRALGGAAPETVFVATNPCRLVDTRSGGGKLQPDSPRSFKVQGDGATFAAQGGNANGCVIPDNANAVEVTITAVEAGSGFLRAWPEGGSQPLATFLNYGPAINLSNSGTLKVCTVSCAAGDLRLRAFGSPTHVVVDVQGYYMQTMTAVVSDAGVRVRSSRAGSSSRTSQGIYRVNFDREIRSCTMSVAVGGSNAADALASGMASAKPSPTTSNQVLVNTYAVNGNLTDKPFHLQVFC